MQQQKVAWEVQHGVQSEVQSSLLRLRSCTVCFSRVAENGEVTDMYAVAVLRAPSVPWNPWLRWFTQGSRHKGTNEASHQSTDNGPLSR
jgi:hypothetical protein